MSSPVNSLPIYGTPLRQNESTSVEIGFYILTLLKIENIQKGLTLPKSIIVSLTANVF